MSSLAAFIPLLSATRTAASKTLHRLNSVRVIPATPQWPVWYFKLGKITTAIQDHFKRNCESGPEVHFVTTLLNSYALLFAEVGLTGAVRKTWYTWHICTCVCRVCKHCRTDLEIAKLRWTILRYLWHNTHNRSPCLICLNSLLQFPGFEESASVSKCCKNETKCTFIWSILTYSCFWWSWSEDKEKNKVSDLEVWLTVLSLGQRVRNRTKQKNQVALTCPWGHSDQRVLMSQG